MILLFSNKKTAQLHLKHQSLPPQTNPKTSTDGFFMEEKPKTTIFSKSIESDFGTVQNRHLMNLVKFKINDANQENQLRQCKQQQLQINRTDSNPLLNKSKHPFNDFMIWPKKKNQNLELQSNMKNEMKNVDMLIQEFQTWKSMKFNQI